MRRRAFVVLLGATAAGWPRALRADDGMPVIGFLSSVAPGPYAAYAAAFRQGLSESGYVEGKSVAIEYRWAEGHYDRLGGFADDLVRRKVAVIATSGGPASARAAKNATATIPIVFVVGGDPVGTGLVASFAHPGGNLTGINILTVELMAKRFELLSELVPEIKVMALLVNPNGKAHEAMIHDVQQAAEPKRVELRVLKAASESEIDAAFAALEQLQGRALVVGSDPFFHTRREQFVALAARYAVPAIYESREFAVDGGLISYGTSLSAVYRRVGLYVARILKGEKPSELPVQQPTTFELVVNLKTANALGVRVPPALLARADEVIE